MYPRLRRTLDLNELRAALKKMQGRAAALLAEETRVAQMQKLIDEKLERVQTAAAVTAKAEEALAKLAACQSEFEACEAARKDKAQRVAFARAAREEREERTRLAMEEINRKKHAKEPPRANTAAATTPSAPTAAADVTAEDTDAGTSTAGADKDESGGADGGSAEGEAAAVGGGGQAEPGDPTEGEGGGGGDDAAIRAVFETFDADNSGDIDAGELHAALSALGMETSSSDAAEVLARYDADHSGGIDYEEFQKLVAALHEAVGHTRFEFDGTSTAEFLAISDAKKEEYKEAFAIFDVNGGIMSARGSKEESKGGRRRCTLHAASRPP